MKLNPALNNILTYIWSFLTDDDVKKKRNKLFFLIILLVSAGISLVAVFTHEPFRDEAQAWLIAANSPLSNMINVIRHEGHPFLWFIILKPFAVLGFPYITMHFISWLINALSLYIISYKYKISNVLKLLVVLNPFFLYWFPVVSRNYVLCAFLIVLLGWLYPIRNEKSIAYAISCALLFSTHIIMVGFGISIIVVEIIDLCKMYKDNKLLLKRKIIAIVIEIFGLLFFIFQIYNTLQTNADVKRYEKSPIDYLYNLLGGGFDLSTNFVGSDDYTSYFYVYEKMPVDIQFIFGIFFIFTFFSLALAVLKHLRTSLFFYLGIGCNVAVQTLVYFVNIQRTGLIFVNLLFLIIVLSAEPPKIKKQRKDNKKDVNINVKLIISTFLCITTVISLIISPSTYFIKDFNKNFVGCKDGVKIIQENVPKGSTIICLDDFYCSSVIPYLEGDYLFFSPYTKKEYKYCEWTEEIEEGEEKIFSKYQDILNMLTIVKNPDVKRNIDIYNSFLMSINSTEITFFDDIRSEVADKFSKGVEIYLLLSYNVADLLEYDNSICLHEFIESTNSNPIYDEYEDYILYSLII